MATVYRAYCTGKVVLIVFSKIYRTFVKNIFVNFYFKPKLKKDLGKNSDALWYLQKIKKRKKGIFAESKSDDHRMQAM